MKNRQNKSHGCWSSQNFCEFCWNTEITYVKKRSLAKKSGSEYEKKLNNNDKCRRNECKRGIG
jgi:hypothetical protein